MSKTIEHLMVIKEGIARIETRMDNIDERLDRKENEEKELEKRINSLEKSRSRTKGGIAAIFSLVTLLGVVQAVQKLF